ncbi:MAG: 3-dehydroquinate synthase [Roseiflexaceae bacterium]
MTELFVRTPGGSYPVIVSAGALAQLPEWLEQLGLRGTCWLISDAAVQAAFAEPLTASLATNGRNVHSYSVRSGEPSKDLATAMELYTWMIGGGVERRDVVLALGGGVIGDLAGFVAATVLRGVAVIQLPTTLLAMVDSSVGGKTGINHPLGKNLIGSFHQPRLVLADTGTLGTLPPRELRSGWAEVIKHGVIRDAGLFTQLEQEPTTWRSASAALIQRAVAVKVEVVNIDERETGERMLLNYGHTLGHAVEALAGYGELLHGEAIAIGMDLEAQIADRLGMLEPGFVARQRALLSAYGLPTLLPEGMHADDLIRLTLRDKKVRAGRVRWVLPTGIGGAVVREDIPEELVRNILTGAA